MSDFVRRHNTKIALLFFVFITLNMSCGLFSFIETPMDMMISSECGTFMSLAQIAIFEEVLLALVLTVLGALLLSVFEKLRKYAFSESAPGPLSAVRYTRAQRQDITFALREAFRKGIIHTKIYS